MIFLYGGMVLRVEKVHMVRVGDGIKKARWVNLSGNMHFSGYHSCSERSRTRAQRLGEIMGEGDKLFFLNGGMVWGVELVHIVRVGGGIKKARRVVGFGNMHFRYYLSHSEGSRTRAQRLGEIMG